MLRLLSSPRGTFPKWEKTTWTLPVVILSCSLIPTLHRVGGGGRWALVRGRSSGSPVSDHLIRDLRDNPVKSAEWEGEGGCVSRRVCLSTNVSICHTPTHMHLLPPPPPPCEPSSLPHPSDCQLQLPPLLLFQPSRLIQGHERQGSSF